MRWLGALVGRGIDAWRKKHRLGERAPQLCTPKPRWPEGRNFLHVGCGRQSEAGPGFQSDDWQEVRLDIDPGVAPDIVASMLDMSIVPDASADALYSSHNIEHLYPHEAPRALREFWRVLKPEGFAVITCPDLQSVARLIVDDGLEETAYVSAAGPIAPLDILYGHRPQIAAGNLFMAHRCGFTLATLVSACRNAGFSAVTGKQRAMAFDLWVLATKSPMPENELQKIAARHFPATV